VFTKATSFEVMLEAVPDALVGMDQKGMIRFVNRQTELLFGYDREDLIGQPIDMLVPEPLWQIYASHRDEYFADPRTRSSGLDLELSGRHRDGWEFPVNVSLSHIDTGDVLLVITGVREVAKQKRAVKNAELQAAIVEYSEDAIIGSTLDGIVTSWNPAAQRLYGYSSREIIGRSAALLVPGDRADELSAHLARVREGKAVHHVETVRVRKDGAPVPVSLTLAPIHDEDGMIIGASSVHRDVTAQRQAFEVAQRLASIVESSDDAIISRTLDDAITSWNPAAERMYGYSRQEIIGSSIRLLVPEDRYDEIETVLSRITAGQHEQMETVRLRKNGTAFPVSITVSPIRDARGEIVGLSAIHRDVTEQRRAFDLARRMEAIVENSGDAIVAGAFDGTIISWNPAAERMYGYSSEEIVGKPISILVPEGRRDEMVGVQERIRAGEGVQHIETVRVRKDGTTFLAAITASVLRDADGKIIGTSAIVRDVTEQRRALEVAQRMEAIVESCDDPIIGQTLEGLVTSWNPAATRTYGYTAQEIIGKPISLLMPPDRKHEMAAILARIRLGEHVEHLHTIRMRKDGTWFPISVTISPVLGRHGELLGAAGIGRDMTKQEHAAHYARSVIEADLDPLVAISLEGRISDVNEAAVRITGQPRERLLGSDYAQYVTEPDKAQQYFQQTFEKGSVTDFPMTVRHRDGTLIDLLCHASVYRDIKGDVLGVVATGRDMAQQKRASAAIQRMAAIVESSDDAIIGATLNATITSWNPAAARIFGYSSQEAVGNTVDFLSPSDLSAETSNIEAEIRAGRAIKNLETSRTRKDGTVITVSLTISPVRDPDGTVVGASVICRDVTALKHAAQYTRSLIEAALDPLVTISASGKITDVNEATVSMTGVPRDKLIGTDFSHYFTEPDKAHEVYQRVFEQGSVTDFPLTLRHRDDALTDVLYNASVYRDTNGNVLGVLAAARDMTKHKEAFEAAERMAAVVEHSDDAIIGSTLEGTVTSWNPAAERMYGYPSHRMVRRPIDLLSPKERAGEISSTLAKIRSGERVDNFETFCIRKDKSTFPVKLTIAPIHDATGAVVGASAIARDVTEQRQALAAAQQMAAIIESSDDAIFSRTHDGVITSWNRAAERLYGYSAEEIIGKSINLTIPRDRAGEAETIMARVRDGQHVDHLETIRARKDGTLFPVSITVSPIRDPEGAVVGASAIARDMSEHEHAAQYTRSLIEAALDPLVTISPEGKLNDVNEATVRVTGVPREELIGTDFSHYFTEPEKARQGYRQAFSQGTVTDYPLTLRHRDGTLTDVLYNASVYRDSTGKVLGLYAAAHRLTSEPGSTRRFAEEST
jgi:PAS domain S-box-containing protein